MKREKIIEILTEVMISLDIKNRYGYLIDTDKGVKLVTMLMILEEISEDEKLFGLLMKLKEKSFETYLHSFDVFMLMYLLNPRATMADYRGALFHDIGKLMTPNAILAKKSSLTDEEYEEMKKHTIHGERILLALGYVEESQIAKYHHEHKDGNGYYGMKEEQMSTVIKLMSIIDVFSALTLKRSYKAQMSNQEAFRILFSSESSYDSELLRSFSEKCLV